MTPDPIEELQALLAADSAVVALAVDRVYGGELDPDVNEQMPVAAVVLAPAGGPGRPGTLGVRRNRIDTICFGATLEQAWQLHIAVREALETMSRTDTLFSVETTSDGALARDATTQWPTCYASYSVLSAIDP